MRTLESQVLPVKKLVGPMMCWLEIELSLIESISFVRLCVGLNLKPRPKCPALTTAG